MTDLSRSRLWVMRLSFVALALVILFFHLLPLETTPRPWAGPDLLLGFACAWGLRRPEYVPALFLALVFLLADLLLQRPPGLWAVLALIGVENLKSRGRQLRDASFAAEWLTVVVILTMVIFANRILLSLALVPTPAMTLNLTELALTALAYPLIVAVTHGIMGVRKTAPGDLDALGKRV
ncbi:MULTISPECIES: rod shape-determining protein MreD [Sulfitobacter]|jgi:rod shape-determining protein MreD|uniref:Rod shape-determining protein MreD n=1 Tax=Sulfitobacter profundi TaxID=2679961 RepID=A0ABW1YVY5_9RHOB|nr:MULTISPECIES: rod shape-determining protein MreD [Sulfitobacter]AYE85149.1 rod shape-determining protein MreD [Sulfitobacter sp. D7]UWR37956.1 rod shape-determining protein MreD [Sulfitobacter sp. W074]